MEFEGWMLEWSGWREDTAVVGDFLGEWVGTKVGQDKIVVPVVALSATPESLENIKQDCLEGLQSDIRLQIAVADGSFPAGGECERSMRVRWMEYANPVPA